MHQIPIEIIHLIIVNHFKRSRRDQCFLTLTRNEPDLAARRQNRSLFLWANGRHFVFESKGKFSVVCLPWGDLRRLLWKPPTWINIDSCLSIPRVQPQNYIHLIRLVRSANPFFKSRFKSHFFIHKLLLIKEGQFILLLLKTILFFLSNWCIFKIKTNDLQGCI